MGLNKLKTPGASTEEMQVEDAVQRNPAEEELRDEIGEKEMWNARLSSDPWEMAQLCKEKKVTVLGHCKDIAPKQAMFSGDLLDIGVCAEDEDGYRFWCHFRSSDIDIMKKRYQRYQEYKKKDIFS